MPVVPTYFGDGLAAAALQRLKTAVQSASAGSPLAGVYVPDVRWQELPDGTLAAFTVFGSGGRGQGISRMVPNFQVVDTINIVGELALGREDGIDLDTAGGQLIQAILDILFEDSTFLELFGWVESFNVEKEPASSGKDSERYDRLAFRIQLELAGGQTLYRPTVPAASPPLQVADVKTTVRDVTVESQKPLPQ